MANFLCPKNNMFFLFFIPHLGGWIRRLIFLPKKQYVFILFFVPHLGVGGSEANVDKSTFFLTLPLLILTGEVVGTLIKPIYSDRK